ncbi:thiamine biosynthesis protein ThiS [Peptacetobacter hiranonis DSM 13275]|uniref:Thiamine biosynthesis protein ThiS n=2 Tax=Clostridia TaxID=186801 RepID=B6FX27_PEPHT|nr:thiamine biosynthesis protein ThiS [Peptacetobacter hiranonis DSM 13275]
MEVQYMKVNGKEVQFPEGTTVSQILDNYKIDRNRVVVEIDMKIVDESEYDTYIPDKEAMVELIAFVGGG